MYIYKSNELIYASYKLSVQSQKLILSCLAKLDYRYEISKEITLSAHEFSELMGIDLKNAHRELYKAADCLFDSKVLLKKDINTYTFRWVQKSVEKHTGNGAVTLRWTDDVMVYISQLKDSFTGYKLRNISQLQSAYSIRIYELLMKWKSTGCFTIMLDDFKYCLGIIDKYSLYKDFNKWVIKPSIRELNKYSDLIVNVDQIKQGRKVTGLVFRFHKSTG